METNIANHPAFTIYLVSAKHKYVKPMRKKFYKEKRTGIAHFKILRFATKELSHWFKKKHGNY